MSPETMAILFQEVRDEIKAHGDRLTGLERSIWWLFGAGAGVGLLAAAVASGTLKGLVG